jgi:hypothetical protein
MLPEKEAAGLKLISSSLLSVRQYRGCRNVIVYGMFHHFILYLPRR